MKWFLNIARIVAWVLSLYLIWNSLRLIADTGRHSYASFPLGRRLEIAWPTFAVGVLLVLPYWKARGRLLRFCLLGIFGLTSLTAFFWCLMGVIAVIQAEDTPSTIPFAAVGIVAIVGNCCYVHFKKEPIQSITDNDRAAPGRV